MVKCRSFKYAGYITRMVEGTTLRVKSIGKIFVKRRRFRWEGNISKDLMNGIDSIKDRDY